MLMTALNPVSILISIEGVGEMPKAARPFVYW